MMKVSILIGTRNRPQMVMRCIKSVLAQTYPLFEVFVLDDASDQVDICSLIRERFADPRVRCLRVSSQLGVSGGRNRLINEATGEILCVIDDDAYFEHDDAVAHIVETFRFDERIGIVAVKVVEYRRGRTELLIPFPRWCRRLRPRIGEEAQYVSYYLGGCHAIRREVVQRCGLYSLDMFFGDEELDLAYRAIDAGYRIYYQPLVVVRHDLQPSVVGKGAQGRKDELYHHVKNRIYLAYRYLPGRYVPVYLTAWLAYYAVSSLRQGAVEALVRGLRDGVLRLKHWKRKPLSQEAVHYLHNHYGRLWF